MAKYNRKRRIGNSLTRKLLVLLLLTTILFASTVWGATARYTYQSKGESLVKAKEFYFTSDYLTPEGMRHTLNPGTTEITFELRNYDGLKVSELDINYSVKRNGTEVLTGTITHGTEQAVPVTLSGLTPGSYTVMVEGTNGYSRILSAIFEVKDSNDGIFKHTENYGDYVLLTVWTQGETGTATVSIPAGVIPDYTDTSLTGKSAGGTFNVTLGKDESRSYRFFTTGAYVKEPVTVTSDGKPVPEKDLN